MNGAASAPHARGPARIAVLTGFALVAFAANSLLCRGALGAGRIDAASFTTIRLVAGAVTLGLLRAASAVPVPAARGTASVWSALALFAYQFDGSNTMTRTTPAPLSAAAQVAK